ncbi:phosphatase PAP2 family protein [Bacillus sp. T3]|uniref:phosphatase PAP2 family protein n=1 Tax=Bacillus sp. T3 TaxID=467262 RepID=UPI0029815E12|nr:phosphatase PAP2 family protein [Bacillus sp. T3]
MNLKVHLLWAFIISVVSLIGFSMMALTISSHHIALFDKAVISFVQGFENPTLTSIMKIFTYIGNTKSVIVVSLLVLFFLFLTLKNHSEFVLFTIFIIATPILNGILKNFFHRARPDLHRLIEIGGYSFPSGHAMNAMAAYGMIAFLLWRHLRSALGRTVLILICSVFILMIGISRIYLGVHYPSDIIAGYFASGFWLSTVIWFFQRYREKLFEARIIPKK